MFQLERSTCRYYDMAESPIRLQRDGTCRFCHELLVAGTVAWWGRETRAITCLVCADATGAITGDPFAASHLWASWTQYCHGATPVQTSSSDRSMWLVLTLGVSRSDASCCGRQNSARISS